MKLIDYIISYHHENSIYQQTFCSGKLSKYEEDLEKILFKGYLISNFGIEVDISKIKLRKM